MPPKAQKSELVPHIFPKPEDTRASLCIYKEDLDPQKISDMLDLEPTTYQKKGGQKVNVCKEGSGQAASVGGWFLSTHESVKDLNAEHHIQWLVEQISNRHSAIHELLGQNYRIEIWVYWLASSSNASPTLTPDLMRRLANLGIPIVFDIYF